jgi:arylsulfatase A-like enzyme
LSTLPELTEDERVALTTVTRQRAEALHALDRQIGLMVDDLRATGQLERTVIAFTSDNGYYLGEHRKRQGKIELHEPSLRVPFLIAGPDISQGRRYDPITTVDLAPTFAALAGIAPVPGADGVDMTPVIAGGDRGWNRPVVTEGVMGEYPRLSGREGFGSALNTRGIRLGRWKLIEYSTGESELYDLGADPLELENLAGEPAYTQVLAELRELWLGYEDCAGAECAAALPEKWRTSVERTRVITDNEARQVAAYFGATTPSPR